MIHIMWNHRCYGLVFVFLFRRPLYSERILSFCCCCLWINESLRFIMQILKRKSLNIFWNYFGHQISLERFLINRKKIQFIVMMREINLDYLYNDNNHHHHHPYHRHHLNCHHHNPNSNWEPFFLLEKKFNLLCRKNIMAIKYLN